ncbi:hypothetical protein ABUW04_32010 [Streptacidiphilus sp. N1-10]|uniref:Transposase n=1 Tax=Streptacidiphilus jeojiensis TaxID=3229225 RepID=A0ABV6XXA1_9ACTN
MFTVLTTPAGRKLHVSVSLDWTLGAALYRIAEVDGTITLGWASDHYRCDCCNEPSIQLTYGKPAESPFTKRFEDPPTVFGVTLAARTVYRASAMRPGRASGWLGVRREGTGGYDPEAPDGTRRRTAEIVYTITQHWLAQPWAQQLHRAHEQRHAAPRLRQHAAAVRELEEKICHLTAELAEELTAAEEQERIISAGPVAPKWQRPDGLPATSGQLAA